MIAICCIRQPYKITCFIFLSSIYAVYNIYMVFTICSYALDFYSKVYDLELYFKVYTMIPFELFTN